MPPAETPSAVPVPTRTPGVPTGVPAAPADAPSAAQPGPPGAPVTGDGADVPFWLAALALCAIGLASIMIKKR